MRHRHTVWFDEDTEMVEFSAEGPWLEVIDHIDELGKPWSHYIDDSYRRPTHPGYGGGKLTSRSQTEVG